MNTILISISGPSGVGKSTLATIISHLFKNGETLNISGDNFHKWEREDKNWKKLTHLNPKANNLSKAFKILQDLKNGQDIFLSVYNHSTGKFEKETVVKSKPVIIYEGLHALYDSNFKNLSNISIFVDTEESLTNEWKIKRDTFKRGYSIRQAEEQIKKRKTDQKKFIDPQKENADIIATFFRTASGKINLKLINKSNLSEEIIKKISTIFSSLMDLLYISNHLMMDPSLIQGKGGNISVKFNNKLIIKASGVKIFDINISNGFVICNRKNRKNKFKNEEDYNKFIKSLIFKGDKLPSMETGFHNFISDKVVIHTHPIYLNAILCSKEGKSIIKKIFSAYSYKYIPYVTPGYKLCNCFIKKCKKKIFFLENHGLIVASDNIQEALYLTEEINSKCKKWIEKNKENFIESISSENRALFPDAVVFKEEMKNTNDFILNLINYCNLNPKFLSYKNEKEILSLKSEKYRKN